MGKKTYLNLQEKKSDILILIEETLEAINEINRKYGSLNFSNKYGDLKLVNLGEYFNEKIEAIMQFRTEIESDQIEMRDFHHIFGNTIEAINYLIYLFNEIQETWIYLKTIYECIRDS